MLEVGFSFKPHFPCFIAACQLVFSADDSSKEKSFFCAANFIISILPRLGPGVILTFKKPRHRQRNSLILIDVKNELRRKSSWKTFAEVQRLAEFILDFRSKRVKDYYRCRAIGFSLSNFII